MALGNFDGVHLGHQALVKRAVAFGETHKTPSLVFTFEPHPTRVLAPHLAPPLIIPLEHRLALLEELRPTATVLEPFTAEFARMSAEDFVKTVLVGALRVKHVVIGYNFTFGHKRGGNPELLARMAQELGFTLDVVHAVDVEGLAVSSTKIRELILEGNVRGATILLGRPFSVRGTVVTGHQRGRTIGFPTANVQSAVELLPKLGVYAARFGRLEREVLIRPCVVNVGVAPTFGGGAVTVEAHVMDFDGDLYGQRVEVHFVERLRDEQRFPHVDALKAQIGQDVARARAVLG